MAILFFRIFYPKSSYSQRLATTDQRGRKPGLGSNPFTREGISPLLQVNIELAIPNIELKPNLEECQSVINDAIRSILSRFLIKLLIIKSLA